MLVLALAAACAAVPQQPKAAAPIHAVVLTGANNHEWEWTSNEIAGALRETGRFDVEVVTEPSKWLVTDAAHAFGNGALHVLVLDYNGPRWGDVAERAFVQT